MVSPPRFVLLGAIALACSSGCESKSKSDGAPASSPSGREASGSEDQLPAIEVRPASAPKYSLAKLTEGTLSALLSKNGWTPTAGGRTSSGSSGSGVRVSAYKQDTAGNLECKVHVRCSEPGTARPSGEARPGEAYYNEGACEMKVEVQRGIRKKSAESKRLLELLLASQPG